MARSQPPEAYAPATWEDVDEAFWAQRSQEIFAALTRPVDEIVPPAKVRAFRSAVEGVRAATSAGLPLTLARVSESPKRGRARARVDPEEILAHYEEARKRYEQVKAAWQKTLPSRTRTREASRQARQTSSERLQEELRAAFPDMPQRELQQLVAGAVERRASEVRHALMSHVGSRFMRGVSTVRDLVASVRRARERRKRVWRSQRRFLKWVSRTRPAELPALARLLDMLERAKPLAQPAPDFYAIAGPLYLDFIRGMMVAAVLERRRPFDADGFNVEIAD